MAYRLKHTVRDISAPPVLEVQSWLAGARSAPDKPLLDVAPGEPRYPPDDRLVERLAALVREPETARYTDIRGLPALRAGLAEHTAALYGGAVSAEQVGVTAGCNQAYALALMSLAGKGDEVLLPVPYYFDHHLWLEALGVRTVALPFRADRAGVPDPDDAEARIGPRSRAIVLVTPNNPTGAVYPADVIEAFYDLARRHRLALVVDETYRDFLPPEPPHGLFARPDWPATLVHLYSFSKGYCLTGYRVGAVIADTELIDSVTKLMGPVTICAPRIGQEAARFGLESLGDWRDDKRALMERRLDALYDAFRRADLGYKLVSAGVFFAYVRHPFADASSVDVARHLAVEHNVLCLPGSYFGPDQEAYLRFAFANLEAECMAELADCLAASQS